MNHKIISTILSSALMISALSLLMNASAETTYASAGDFLENVMKMATSNITSETKETAINNVVSNITVTGNEVFYETESIGYWFSDASDTLYKDAEKTVTLIESGQNGGYVIDSSLLSELLTDVNDGITETYEPTSTDWSKIIGKYDITLGDTVIPMNNWVEISVDSTEEWATFPSIGNNSINISRITGVTIQNISSEMDYVMAFSWLVDQNGELYISNNIETIGKCWGTIYVSKLTHGFGEASTTEMLPTNMQSYQTSDYPWITLGARITTTVIDPSFSYSRNASLLDKQSSKADDASYNILRNVNDPSIIYSGTLAESTHCGIAYFIKNYDFSDRNATGFSKLATEHNNFWTTFETTKTVVGNSTLVKRISKISNLNTTDVLVVSPTGWTVNGTDVDIFLGTQTNTVPGGATDVDVNIEIENKNFVVTLPTALPVFVSRNGDIHTATNATILNESNAAVKITDLAISAKPDSDWTLVDANPSQEAGMKEFSFNTSLSVDNTINAGADLPFTYNAAFSPEIYNCENFSAATVTITLDWAN